MEGVLWTIFVYSVGVSPILLTSYKDFSLVEEDPRCSFVQFFQLASLQHHATLANNRVQFLKYDYISKLLLILNFHPEAEKIFFQWGLDTEQLERGTTYCLMNQLIQNAENNKHNVNKNTLVTLFTTRKKHVPPILFLIFFE